MQEPECIPKNGTKLYVTELFSTSGFLIANNRMVLRRAGEEVEMMGYVPGHGGDVWWCKHANGDLAPYSWSELEYVNKKDKPKLSELEMVIAELNKMRKLVKGLLNTVRAKYPESFVKGGKGFTCKYMKALNKMVNEAK